MCGPAVLLNLVVLDVAFVMVVLGAAMVFKVKTPPLPVWLLFGGFASIVGGFLFWGTYAAQAAAADSGGAIGALTGAC